MQIDKRYILNVKQKDVKNFIDLRCIDLVTQHNNLVVKLIK